MEIKRISDVQERKINAKLKILGLELAGASITDNKAHISINKGCAATYDHLKVVDMLKNSFGTKLSAVIVDGREYAV